MKKKFTFLIAALALLTCLAIPMGMVGQTYKLQQVTSVEDGGLYVFEQGGYVMNNTVSSSALQTTNTYSTTGLAGTETYVWTLETTTNGFYMKNVSLNSDQYLNNTGTTGVSLGNKNSIWAFNFQTDNTVWIQNYSNSNRFLGYTSSTNHSYKAYATSNLSGNSYPHSIKVYKLVEESGSSVTAPTITPASCNFTGTKEITITPASGTTMYYTTNGNDPDNTLIGYTTAQTFNISATTTVKAIAYDGSDHSSIVSATYTYFTPLTTMQQIFTAATTTATTVAITFDNWVVSGINYYSPSTMAFVTNGNGEGCVIYNTSGHGFAVGNIISGTVICSLQKIYGYARINDITASDVTVNTGGTVNVSNIALADLAGVNTGALVSYNNLECTVNDSKYYLTDGITSLQVYKALWDFTYSTYLEAGKTYNITGIYQQYTAGQSDTKEILPRSAADIEEVVSTTPFINASDVTLDYDATSGSIAYSIDNSVTGFTLGATCDAAWVSNITVGAESVTFTTSANEGDADRTATFTLTYTGAQNKTVTVTQGHHVVDYAELPFSFNGGRADIANTTGLTQEGLDSDFASEPKLKFNTTGDNLILKINERPGELSFDIKGSSFSGGTFTVQTSIDGVTYTDLRAYTNLTSDLLSEEFSNLGENVRYIKWIYTKKSSGNVALGNIALAAYVAPQPYDLTVTLAQNVDAIYVFDAADENNSLIEDGAAGTVQVTAGTSIMVSPDILDPGYVLASLIVDGNDVTSQMSGGAYTFTMPSHAVAISATAAVAPVTTTYTLATSIENGRHYIITNGNDKAMGDQGNNNRSAVSVTIENGIATVNSDDEVYEVVINGPDANGFYTIYDANIPGYLYAAGGTSSNYLKTQTFCDNKGQWNISFDGENVANIVANFSDNNARNTMRYNNSNNLFSCYSGGQQDIYLYVKKDETTPQYDFYKDIAAASNWSTESVGWSFIASPLASDYTPNGSMLANNYDLYQLNNTTWENYKEHDGNNSPGFKLVNGRGYLYANSANVTLHFSGSINTFTTEGNANVKSLPTGWNLIGNPYNIPIYINKPYYKMNAAGDDIETTDGITSVAIPACTGVIVNAGENESVTFSTTAPAGANNNHGNVQIALAQTVTTRGESSSQTLDNAIVSFNEGSQLEKFYFGTQDANIYIPQGNEEYAIVSAAAQGEMPVNFKAAVDGQYTLTVNPDDVVMNYLHLIDNLTGADIDLLANPSYTFNARNDDYASRFRLVFSVNGVNEYSSDNFAFISNGQIILTEEGDVQVYDVMGRMISSHNNVSHITTEGMAAGVYVIRLTNGSETMTQKLVVK